LLEAEPERLLVEGPQFVETRMGDLILPIREFYIKGRRNITDAELAMEIERRFGDRILNEVCIPHGLYMGACLLIAIQAASA
jgi:hypothetical protein